MRLIAVSLRVDEVASYKERRDALDQRWYSFLEQCGCTAVLIPNASQQNTAKILSIIKPDGILLTGGNTITALNDKSSLASPERDETELSLFNYALEADIPVIGVCRGMQYLLHFFGIEHFQLDGHVATRHDVHFQLENNKLKREVNSFHSWAASCTELPTDISVLAHDNQGHLEAFMHKTKKIMGLMWHPEREDVFDKQDITFIKEFFYD